VTRHPPLDSDTAEVPPAGRVAPVGVRARIGAAGPTHGGADARVARLVLEQPDTVIYQSVSEVADAAETSTATVVRFAQKLGFKGFHELKLALAQDLATFERKHANSDEQSVLERVTAAGARSVQDAAVLVNADAFEAAVGILNRARRVLWVGVGTSAPLAQDGAYRFRAVGVESEAPADVHVQHVAGRLLDPSDACVAISHTGSTRETLAVIEAARTAGAHTIAITSFLHSPLTDLADVSLTAGSREVGFRLEAMASRLAHMAVIDALLVAVAERDPERSERALDHYTHVLGEHRF
jgi:RpiR family carbohydrate utilization transcriptional regulator